MKLGHTLLFAVVILALIFSPVSAKSDNANEDAAGQDNVPGGPGQAEEKPGNADGHSGAPGQSPDVIPTQPGP
jgi:hypothetical protein